MKNYNKILEAINRGIRFALDDYEDDELQGQTNSKVSHQHGTKEYLDFVNEVVDLGLPSGTLWCKYNLDVNPNLLTKAEDWYGGYYAWGETINKHYYGWNNYKFGSNYDMLTKYCYNGLKGFTDNLTLLLPEDDAACLTKKLHNFKFHIPTKDQFDELLKYTNNYWVKNYDPNKLVHNPKDDKGIQGLNGRIFTSKINENTMFIPTSGYRNGSCIDNVGSDCRLWSSSLHLDFIYNAYDLHFYSDNICMYDNNRCHGFSIRPVINL